MNDTKKGRAKSKLLRLPLKWAVFIRILANVDKLTLPPNLLPLNSSFRPFFSALVLLKPLLCSFSRQTIYMEVKVFHLPLLLTRPVRKMRKPAASSPKPKNFLVIRGFLLLLLSCIAAKLSLCFSNIPSSLLTLSLDGHLNFDEVQHMAKDFGNRYQLLPLAVLHPKTVTDIAITIKHIWQMGPHSELTVAARGHGHSLQGQAQAYQGVVVNMKCLQSPLMQVHGGKFPYVDVSGGELWINILRESMKYGLAPKSWTDYLHLTVGGTLSNAGISGQAFRHGPQISNVHQLEVITGTTDAKVKETNGQHTSS